MIGKITTVMVLANDIFSLVESLEIRLKPSESELSLPTTGQYGSQPPQPPYPPTHEMNHKTDKALSNGERITMTLAISH